ncbi:hypothetical protein F8388_020031 [Cannabis sativa]|uniref:DUF4005 domain-containing protein n=1 Tax=Cannabis sativa TaxID=3483 RepID=A0A7J6ER60_CANSA|nr:hypothetical protein F8388_020031 [Cannabis sativa]
MSAKEDGSTEAANCSKSPEDAEKIRLEQAATKAQAAFRGRANRTKQETEAKATSHKTSPALNNSFCILLYLCHLDDLKARREFRSLKGLIVLQADFCGHLVRRQVVSTLSRVKGILKFQTLVRHQKGAIYSNSKGVGTSTELLDSLPTAVPLHLQYDSREPNSATLWLERWTISRFWEPFSEQKENSESKSRRKHESSRSIETKQDKSKTRPRRLSGAKVEIGLDSEKCNRNPRKVSSLPINSVQEHSQNETRKVKTSLRKATDPSKDCSDQSEVQNAQPKRKMRKPLGSAAPDILEPEAKELSCKDDCIRNDSQKTSQRRASLPAKFDPQENVVHDTPKLPSYMAPTESAKARLRGQGSPRLSRDVVEKNALLRRHSLSSSTNSMLTSLSPRASKLVQVTSKGVIRGDRSLSSSRDGGVRLYDPETFKDNFQEKVLDKLIQAEWRSFSSNAPSS